MDVLVTLLFAVGLGASGVLFAAVLGVRGRAPFAVAVLVLAAAAAVLASTVLSAFDAWTRGGMLAALLVTTVAAGVAWVLTGRPRPPRPRRGGAHAGGSAAAASSAPAGAADTALAPLTRVALALAGVVLAVQLYVGARVASGNWDSMTYHLSRAAYWLQEQSITQFPGASVRQSASAPNGEVLQGLTMMATGTDRWVESVQWLSLIGIALVVFSTARLLRFTVNESAFAAALFVLLPQPVMQAASTQNDLIVSFFTVAAAFFAVRAIRDRHLGDMAVGAAALGLAIGTKGTIFIAGLAIAVVVLAALVKHRPGPRFVAASIALALVSVVALGSYNYVLNLQNRGNALGGVQEQTRLKSERLPNAVRAGWSWVEAPGVGLSWLDPAIQHTLKPVLEPLAEGEPFAVDTGVQEDTVAFGFIGWIVLPLVLLVALLGRRSTIDRRALALGVVLYVVAFCATIEFNPWLGRLFMPAMALGAPLLALTARRPAIAGVTLALAVLTLVGPLLQNPGKPVLVPEGQKTVFALHRDQQMTLVNGDVAQILPELKRHLGPRDRMFVIAGEDAWDYPLFGPHRERHLIRELDTRSITYDRMKRERVSGAYYANSGPPPPWLRAIQLVKGADYYWVPARR